MGRRNEQVASLLKAEVQAVIARGFADPRIRGLITVTSVDLVEEGHTAIVRVSILPEDKETLTMHGLHAAARHVRHEVSDRVALRVVPQLRFELDRGLKNQAAVYQALAEERERAGENNTGPTPPAPDQDGGEHSRSETDQG